MKYDKTILIVDADGTLLTDEKGVLPVDKAAIAEFIENGGLFTVATGRGVAAARSVVETIGLDLLSLPLVVFNGAAIYDFKKEKFLWKCGLCGSAKEYVETLLQRFPVLGTEILVDDDVYVIRTNDFEEEHLAFAGIEPIRCDYSEVPKDGWIKVLLIDTPEAIDEVVAFCEESICEQTHIVRSSPMYYEILPQNVNKWTGIEKLFELTELSNRSSYRIITAGDYMNDLEMIKNSDIGVAPMNAQEVVKDAANMLVCDNNSGIIQDILEKLAVD